MMLEILNLENNMANTHYTYQGVKSILQSNIAKVSFTKVNGDERTMTCTLLPGYIPVSDLTTTRTVNTNALSVIDVNKNDWRAFRIDSINTLEYPVADTSTTQ